MKLSIVVPSHKDPAGLWMTFASCFTDLEHEFASYKDWEFIAVIDGETNEVADSFERFNKRVKVVRGEFGGPQNSRHAGIEHAQGDYVAFLDSHVVPAHGMFGSLLDAAETNDACIVHAPHCFWANQPRAYSYRMDFQNRMWVSSTHNVPESTKPYRVAVMGHGVILVDRQKYYRIGGYSLLQTKWGGEEPLLNLKAWMLGESCYVDPRTHHWHYMTFRHHESVYKQPHYIRNFMLAAYIIGGRKYLDAVYALHTFAANAQPTIEACYDSVPTTPYLEMYEKVPIEAAAERAQVAAGPWAGDLDRLIQWFRDEKISH